jgi:hypothetical protein
MLFVDVCVLLFEHVKSKRLQLKQSQNHTDARAAVTTADSDDDTAPPNGFDEILNEVCEEAGYESGESDEEAW